MGPRLRPIRATVGQIKTQRAFDQPSVRIFTADNAPFLQCLHKAIRDLGDAAPGDRGDDHEAVASGLRHKLAPESGDAIWRRWHPRSRTKISDSGSVFEPLSGC